MTNQQPPHSMDVVDERMRTIDPLLDYAAWILIRLTMTNAYKHAMTVLHRVFG